MNFLYLVRTKLVFDNVKFNYFQINVAHKIIQEYEPSITKNAVYKSLMRSNKVGCVNLLKWYERKNIDGFNELDTNGKLRSIWSFNIDNIVNLSRIIEENIISEEDYPMYAKVLLNDNMNRRLLMEE